MAYFHKKMQKYLVMSKKAVLLQPISRDSVAQQVEHIPFKDGVLGSSPS